MEEKNWIDARMGVTGFSYMNSGIESVIDLVELKQ